MGIRIFFKERKSTKWMKFLEEVAKKNMPLDSYTWTHSEANLTDAQVTD